MITLIDLLDALQPATIAAIAHDVQASGRADLAVQLAQHLSTRLAHAPVPASATSTTSRRLTLTPLDAPVPPMLEAAIGYSRDARLVAFFWQPAGDEACWDDGRQALCGAHWPAYLAYTQHRAVLPHLALYDFGSSEEPARHWLVLDRAERQLYAAPWDVAAAFLGQQERTDLPAPLQAPPTVEELLALLQPDLSIAPAEIAERMAQADRRTQELTAWLDDYAKHQEERNR